MEQLHKVVYISEYLERQWQRQLKELVKTIDNQILEAYIQGVDERTTNETSL
jgi:HD superfamily phosphohydrolase YqeK